MRTSVDLNDRLLTLAKQTAAKRGITMREVFEQALRAYLEPTKKVEGYRLDLRVTRGEVVRGVPIHDWSAFRAWLDEQ
jgi:metal-responsive CopG/Arc/MetJ family transcriptional regulator